VRYLFLILFSALLSLAGVTYAGAQSQTKTLRVTQPFGFDEYTLELLPRQRGDVNVFLQSVGEDVEGYKLYLVRDYDKKAIQSQVSNGAGEATFSDIEPGIYSVILRISARTRRETTVQIGDIVLSVSEGDSKSKERLTIGEGK